jgi:hypothetical protein
MAEFVGSSASQADFIWKNAEDLWGGFQAYRLRQDHFAVYSAASIEFLDAEFSVDFDALLS